jgi:hypothetical protein
MPKAWVERARAMLSLLHADGLLSDSTQRGLDQTSSTSVEQRSDMADDPKYRGAPDRSRTEVNEAQALRSPSEKRGERHLGAGRM